MTAPAMTSLGLSGRTALVSGSTRGVGLAVASALAGAGAKVAINYLSDEEAAQKALLGLRALGATAVCLKADVSREDEAAGLVQAAEAALGPVDVLVNNAHGRIVRTPFLKSSWAEHQAHIDGILKGAYYLTRAVLGGMKARGWGRVVNIGSGMVAQPVRGYSAYTSAMAALVGFTRDLAAEAGPWGVTVNLVAPGFVLTERTPHTSDEVKKAIAQATPLGRLAEPEDVAGAALFLCSELGRFITGACLPVDGGKSMG